MRNLNLLNRLLVVVLMLLASFSTITAQGVDLKEIKATKEAEAIKKYTDLLTNFYLHLYGAIGNKSQPLEKGKVPGGLTDKATKVRSETAGNFDNVQSLIAKLKAANHFDEQFDKDVIKLLGSNKVKDRLTKSGGARKLFQSILNATATNDLKKNISESASLIEFTKDEAVCRFIAVGIIVEVLSSKKSTTPNDKIYEVNGCHK
jgi:hypothetical protein